MALVVVPVGLALAVKLQGVDDCVRLYVAQMVVLVVAVVAPTVRLTHHYNHNPKDQSECYRETESHQTQMDKKSHSHKGMVVY